MFTINAKLKAFLLGVLLGLYCTAPCFAAVYSEDTNRGDTDIFFGGGNGATIKPNVLFVLDNSGSMDNIIQSSGKSRMQTMKESFRSIMSKAQGINVGLMRFNDPGGSVLYPVTDIDKSLSSFSSPLNPVSKDSADDANEAKSESGSAGDGSVNITSTELTLGWDPAASGSSGSSYPSPIEVQVSSSTDDAYEADSDWVDTGSGQRWYEGRGSDIQYMGMRFPARIPPGSTINSAYVEMTSRSSDYNRDSQLRIYAESGTPNAFTTRDNNISDRNRVTGSVTWNISDDWDTDRKYKTPDLTALVQQVINQSGWAVGGYISFIMKRSDESRFIYGYDDSSSKAPKLVVNFTAPSSGGSGSLGTPTKKVVGVRFQDVGVPQGATITRAYIQFVPSQTSSVGENFSANIKIENSSNATAFTTARQNISGRTTVSTATWSVEGWAQDAPVRTPDLNAIVQPVINGTSWCGNNALVFIIEENAGVKFRRKMYSVDAPGSKRPKLVIEYRKEGVSSSSCINQVVNDQVIERPDDAFQSGSTVDNHLSTLTLGNNNTVGLRFSQIPIKQGATILDASLVLTSATADATASSWAIKGEKIVQSLGIPESNNAISGKTFTTASVNWNSTSSPVLGAWIINGEYTSPDLKTVLQEIVNQSGWVANNALTLFISGTGNRSAFSWDGSPGGSAKLRVKVAHGGVDAASYTVREHLINLVDDLDAVTYTPIVDSLYEAALYYRGAPVYYGKKRDGSASTPKRYQRVSHADSYTGGTYVAPSGCDQSNLDSVNCEGERIDGSPAYVSPIKDSCQANYMVLLTDGAANNNHSETLVKSLINESSCDATNYTSGQKCSPELVKWMNSADMNTSISGVNKVKSYTIAFALTDTNAVSYLDKLAKIGGGSAYTASNSAELSSAFSKIISEIMSVDTTFVTPGTTVNQFSRLTNGDEVYYSVFRPSITASWDGNLKKYKIKDGQLIDQNGTAAIDTDPASINAGFFKSTSKSLWSSDIDGATVNKGGMSSKLGSPATRNVYTYYSGASYTLKENPLNYSNTTFKTKISTIYNQSANSTYTSTYVQKLVDWARGMDIDDIDKDGDRTDSRQRIGDPLHSAPVSVTYGGNSTTPDSTLFIATNQGMLHAVDADDGTELFAFMPGEFLSKIEKFYLNATSEHIYGLDGQITPHIIDFNGDGIISGDDKVYLYVGMGRGGNKYYALDVTDRTNPKLLWIIDGDDTTNFPELGESWSQADFGFVKIGSAVTPVVIVGAGYQKEHDTRTTIQANTQGNAIYMIEARPNSAHKPVVLWSANKTKFADMQYSIPAKVNAIDMDSDGLLDQMYVGDLGGQLWRFDITNGVGQSDLIKGGVIFNASGTTASTNRRFYSTPDVSLTTKNAKSYVSIALGSGWRGNPLDQSVNDQFYLVRQELDPPATGTAYTKRTVSDLYNASSDLVLQKFTDLATKEAAAEVTIAQLNADIAVLVAEKIAATDPSVIALKERDIAAKQALIDAEVAKIKTAKDALKTEQAKYAGGWYIDFATIGHTGEKVLAQSVTLGGKIIFTSYQPVSSGSSCKAAEGIGRVYSLGAFDASASVDFNGDGVPDRSKKLLGFTIPPDPMILIEGGSDPTKASKLLLCFGTECGYDFGAPGALSEGSYWLEREDLR